MKLRLKNLNISGTWAKKLACEPRDSMNYWLLKTEPDSFSWDDLMKKKNQTTHWDGVRNYQARNNLRKMQVGDRCFFYHSNAKPLAIIGIARVVKEAYPDTFAFDPKSKYYDPKSDPANPRWFMTDIQAEKVFETPVLRSQLTAVPGLEKMELLKKGSMLSVQPVTPAEWEIIMRIANGN